MSYKTTEEIHYTKCKVMYVGEHEPRWGAALQAILQHERYANSDFAVYERELGVIGTITSGTASLFLVAIWKRGSVENYWGSIIKNRNGIIMPLKESRLPTSWNVYSLLVTSKILKLEKAHNLEEI